MDAGARQLDFDVAKIARLARLEVDQADMGPLTKDLGDILEYARCLDALDLAEVEPLSHAADLEASLADDVPDGELPPGVLDEIAPAMDEGFIRVPKVLGDGGGA